MNMTLLIVVSVVLVIIALIWTLFIFKQEENKMKRYEEQGDTAEDQLRRSEEYEKRSLSSDVPLQIIIYGVSTLLFFIALFLYLK